MMVDKEIYDNVYIRYLGTETIEDQYGKKHGLWEDYYSNGQLKETSKYKNGEIILEKVRYDEEGKIIQ